MATHLFSSGQPAGLTCFIPGRSERIIPWDQIENIGTFHRKDELSEYAVVWLRLPTDMFPVEFTERDPSWPDLLKSFSRYLEGILPFDQWFPEPLHPVFEKNAHGIYSKRD